MKFALVGKDVSNSLSPKLHSSIYRSLNLSKILYSHRNPLICESGIHSSENVKFILKNSKIYNFLIGESLLRSDDIGSKLREFTQITL